jgi:hypothetical protein
MAPVAPRKERRGFPFRIPLGPDGTFPQGKKKRPGACTSGLFQSGSTFWEDLLVIFLLVIVVLRRFFGLLGDLRCD